MLDEESGTARCPYDPQHNSTAIYYGKRLYSATVADLSGRDSLLYSRPLRTEQHDSQWLNDPDFVNSFGYEDRVYVFFRETAVENINCGKVVFSRVARVCTNDSGGSRVLKNTWTSFSKARLNCSLPGDFPFFFDEIQSTTNLGVGNVFPTLLRGNGFQMVYGVFSTPHNSLRGSAICAFRLADIVSSFEGPYKEQKTALSNWLPVRETDIPEPHPGKSCPSNGSHSLSDQTLSFIKSHPLMDRAVPAFGGQPILIQTSFNFTFTQIAVDWQVYAADRRYYDILFIGTDNGKVYKSVNGGRGTQIETHIIEVLSVFDDSSPVTSLHVYKDEMYGQAKLIVGSNNEVQSVALSRCHLQTTCRGCIALRDPYCSWTDNMCADSFYGIQSIDTGRHAACPMESIQPEPTLKIESKTESSSTTTATTTASVTACPPCLTKSAELSGEKTSVTTKQKTLKHPYDKASEAKNDREGVTRAVDDSSTSYESLIREKSMETSPSSSYNLTFIITTLLLCIVVSLIIGFAAGYCVAMHRRVNEGLYRVMNKDCDVTFNSRVPSSIKVQNQYDLEPHSCTAGKCFSPTGGKQCNVFINELKSRTASVPNTYAETSLQRLTASGAVDV